MADIKRDDQMTDEESYVARAVEDAIRAHGPNAPLTVARAAIRALDLYRTRSGVTDRPAASDFTFPTVERTGPTVRELNRSGKVA